MRKSGRNFQQDAFDEVDAVTPIARQEEILDMVTAICEKDFHFDNFLDVVDYFKKLINICKQWNYSAYKSDQFNDYKNQIVEMLNSAK